MWNSLYEQPNYEHHKHHTYQEKTKLLNRCQTLTHLMYPYQYRYKYILNP